MAEDKKVVIAKPKDEIGRKSNQCPWCSSGNDDETIGEKFKKRDSIQVNAGNSWQCITCGKNWDKDALGQLWSIDLERGKAWLTEQKMRGLREGTISVG